MKFRADSISKIIGTLLLAALSGCASLHGEVNEGIHPGQSQEQVQAILGQPDAFKKSDVDQRVSYLMYKRRADMCVISFQDDSVTSTECGANPNYRNPAAAILQGAGQGLQNASRNNTTCTTTGGGGYYTTNCH
jgi:hypothetical protein